jgi:hypothetical protein
LQVDHKVKEIMAALVLASLTVVVVVVVALAATEPMHLVPMQEIQVELPTALAVALAEMEEME